MRTYLSAVREPDGTIRNVEVTAKREKDAYARVAEAIHEIFPDTAGDWVIESVARLKKGGKPVKPVRMSNDGELLIYRPTDNSVITKLKDSITDYGKPKTTAMTAVSKPKATPKTTATNFPNGIMRDPAEVISESVKLLAESYHHFEYEIDGNRKQIN
jgi:hypothetical protein